MTEQERMARPLAEVDPQIFEAIQQETRRQHSQIELIASENFTSEAILEAARLKSDGKATRLVVAGCLVERYRDELKAAMPEVDAFRKSGRPTCTPGTRFMAATKPEMKV